MTEKVLTKVLTGVTQAAWAWLIARAVKSAKKNGPFVVVCPTGMAPETVAESLAALGVPGQVFPALDIQPYDRDSASAAVVGQRLAVIQSIKEQIAGVIVTTVPALGVRVVPDVPARLCLKVGERINPERVMARLVELGYSREDVVEDAGHFARRGGVMDIWPAGAEEPVRLEWFDVEIEQMRVFDAATQRAVATHGKVEALRELVVPPAAEVVLDAAKIRTFREQYRQAFPDGAQDEVYRFVSDGLKHAAMSQLLPLFFEQEMACLLDFLPDDARVVIGDETEALADLWGDTVRASFEGRKEVGVTGGIGLQALSPERMYVWGVDLIKQLDGFEQLVLHRFDAAGFADKKPCGVREHHWQDGPTNAAGNRHQAVTMAVKELSDKAKEGWHVLVCGMTAPGLAQLVKVLETEGMPAAQPAETVLQAMGRVSPKGSKIQAVVAPFEQGWLDSQAKVIVVTEADVFGERMGGASVGKRRRKKSTEEMIAHFSELREGDYVVHEDHGIGQFAGMQSMTLDGATQEFIKLLYAGDDRLFVPVESLDVLSRYKGSESGTVVLDKLGTGGWEARKEKVREDLLAMADELIATAAAREMAERVPPVDEVVRNDMMYQEFCAGFPYTLTDDQASVMQDVESDLSGGHPMDRLVVGDVGFGKTEVALRAAFLVAASSCAGQGRQVAVVCPTTLLAKQHFDVFRHRFAGFPMRVAMLSRLVKPAEAKAVKMGLAEGTIDVVVGTHALLSKDITFKNLGLVVIDEEQRFGVAHKERLKQLKTSREDGVAVDVLTLTATPIPRTLQMAVGGVRSLSLITTPPVDRLAVQSHVMAWDNKTLKEAILRELQRGGQVYVVAPHIEDLPRLHDELMALVPQARIGVAHGQMFGGDKSLRADGDGSELERIMTAFYSGELNVLLATTIIESGIDVPKANTLIVYRADRFGLAQLYQLRGRVGRSKARAFAYFLLPEGPMTGDAARRLQILQRLDGLGAGFTLASYDMDLRGFGNLLGKQQSGNIRDIGFELYSKMLREAVHTRQRQLAERKAKRRGERLEPEAMPLERGQVTLKLGVTYLIPETYVTDAALRLQLYRRLAQMADEDGLEEFKNELVDRFGPLPPEVECLLSVMSLRNRAAALNIEKIDVGERGVVIGFARGVFSNPEGLIGYITRHAGVVTVRSVAGGQQLVWHRRVGEGAERLRGVGFILTELEKCAQS